MLCFRNYWTHYRKEDKPVDIIDGVSVVVPSARIDAFGNLLTVVKALDNFPGQKELIIAADREVNHSDFLYWFADNYAFVRIQQIQTRHRGSANARMQALKLSQYGVVLFTDDDCVVPIDWVSRMYEKVSSHGIVAGNLKSAEPNNVYSVVDAYVDQLRMRSIDERGSAKYISFPNFGIDRRYLPDMPFSVDQRNTTEDIELACILKLEHLPICFDESMLMETAYPTTFIGLLKRKVKHAKGVAFLRARLEREKCIALGLSETSWLMFTRWSKLSISAPLSIWQRMIMFVACASYSAGLCYYDRKFDGKLDTKGGVT